jgi:hypothetical protein
MENDCLLLKISNKKMTWTNEILDDRKNTMI